MIFRYLLMRGLRKSFAGALTEEQLSEIAYSISELEALQLVIPVVPGRRFHAEIFAEVEERLENALADREMTPPR